MQIACRGRSEGVQIVQMACRWRADGVQVACQWHADGVLLKDMATRKQGARILIVDYALHNRTHVCVCVLNLQEK